MNIRGPVGPGFRSILVLLIFSAFVAPSATIAVSRAPARESQAFPDLSIPLTRAPAPRAGQTVVNRNTDEGDASPGDGRCDTDPVADGLQCTLRAAIQEANASTGNVTIKFELSDPQSGIAPTTPLPPITASGVTIDGTTQPFATPTKLLVALSGKHIEKATGLVARGANAVVRGLVIRDFRTGISLEGSGGDTVADSWFGVQPATSGYSAKPNHTSVAVLSPGNTIGGSGATDGNVFATSGNFNGFVDYAATLNRNGATPQDEHVRRLRSFGAAILLGDRASNTTIAGNSFGRAPNGKRVGSTALGFGEIRIGNLTGIMVAPSHGTVDNVVIGGAKGNVLSGNFFGVWVLPYESGSVTNLAVTNNLIGPTAPNTPASFFGNGMGVGAAGDVSGLNIANNAIQGNFLGVVLGGTGISAATIQGNAIGVDKPLGDLGGDLGAAEPSIGLRNFIGVILGDTHGVALGGAGQGNAILGNFIGVVIGGMKSQANVVAGNVFGRAQPGDKVSDTLADLGTVIGIAEHRSSRNLIGGPGAGNAFFKTAIPVLSVGTTDEAIQGNLFDGYGVGLLTGGSTRMTVGGLDWADSNVFRRGMVGLWMVNREPTKAERFASHTDKDPLGKKDRQEALTAENTDLMLNSVAPIVGTADLSAKATAIDISKPSKGIEIHDNVFGDLTSTDLGNWVGAWLMGDMTDTTFGGGQSWYYNYGNGANVVAHNQVAGVWVGPPGTGASQVDLRGNSIYENHTFAGPTRGIQGLGIDLLPAGAAGTGGFGITPNDPGDQDEGGNGLQNYPVLTKVTRWSNDSIIVEGKLQSKPDTAYWIDLYASTYCGRFGYGEGQAGIRRFGVKTDDSGKATFYMSAPPPPEGMWKITATATGPEGTSEFSKCVTAMSPQ